MPTQPLVTNKRTGHHHQRERPPPVPPPREDGPTRLASEILDTYEHALRNLKVCIGFLSALLAASIAHTIADGLSVSRGFALAIVAALLIAALALWRQGSRLIREPDPSNPTS